MQQLGLSDIDASRLPGSTVQLDAELLSEATATVLQVGVGSNLSAAERAPIQEIFVGARETVDDPPVDSVRLSGHFKLQVDSSAYGGQACETELLQVDAPVDTRSPPYGQLSVRDALMALPCLTGDDAGYLMPGTGAADPADWSDEFGGIDVLVSRSHSSRTSGGPLHGYTYRVTFLHAPHDLPLMAVVPVGVQVGNSSEAEVAGPAVSAARGGASVADAPFRFALGLSRSDWVHPNSSATVVRDLLEGMEGVDRVIVTRSQRFDRMQVGGAQWQVTLLHPTLLRAGLQIES